jgi:hypothetical protein
LTIFLRRVRAERNEEKGRVEREERGDKEKYRREDWQFVIKGRDVVI